MKTREQLADVQDDVITVNMVTNRTKEKMTVCLEPWADEFVLMPEESMEIHVVSDAWDRLVTVCKPDCLEVWLWGGCRARVYREGREVTLNSFTHVFPR